MDEVWKKIMVIAIVAVVLIGIIITLFYVFGADSPIFKTIDSWIDSVF